MPDRPTSGPAPQWGEYGPLPDPPATPASPPRLPRPAQAQAAPAPRWDRVATIALLGLGIINVLGAIPQMVVLPQALDAAYQAQGIGHYTSNALASAIGVAVNLVSVLLLVAAVLLSIRQLRTGRLAFWVPLVAGATAFIVTGALLAVAMFGDPALPAYFQQAGSMH